MIFLYSPIFYFSLVPLPKQFHDYLYGSSFAVITDNNHLTYVYTTAKLDATGQRWVASLSGYNFTVWYRNGKNNADADGLSRRQEAENDERAISPKTWKAFALSASIMVEKCSFVERLVASDPPASASSASDAIPEQLLQAHGLSSKEWRKAQLAEPTLRFIINYIESGTRLPDKRSIDQQIDRLSKRLDQILHFFGSLT